MVARCRACPLSTNVVLTSGRTGATKEHTMTEFSSGLRVLEMHERQAWHRERADRELHGSVVDHEPRRRVWRRVVRRAA